MIETERLLLREYTQDDFAALYDFLCFCHYPGRMGKAEMNRNVIYSSADPCYYSFG